MTTDYIQISENERTIPHAITSNWIAGAIHDPKILPLDNSPTNRHLVLKSTK